MIEKEKEFALEFTLDCVYAHAQPEKKNVELPMNLRLSFLPINQ